MREPSPTADPEALLAHAGWVQGLAEQLVLDPDRAGDVAQEAWLAALRRPVRRDAGLAAWLSGLVRNAAGSLRRAEARRARREAAAARDEALPSTAELVEQAELQRELVAAVLALDEPYRTTLLLRYVHGRSPKEIAERRGIPGATVRSHLKRGLEQLRARLDERYGGDRRAWAVALLAGRVPSSAPAAAASTATLGVLAMALKTKLALAAALVALAAVGWLAWPAPSPVAPEPPVAAAPSALEAPAGSGPASPATSPAAAEAAAIQRTAAATPAATPVFVGLVHDPDGVPIEGALVALHENVEGWGDRPPVATAISDAGGRFRIEAAPEVTPLIQARAEGHASAVRNPVLPGEEVDLELGWVAAVFGTVTDAETGAPLPGAEIATWTERTTSAHDGSYRLEGIAADGEADLFANAPGFAEVAREVDLEGPGETRLDLALSRGVPLTITVVDAATDSPVPGAELSRFPGIGEPFARTDDEGRAALRVVEGGELQLVVQADGYSPFSWLWDVAGPAQLAPRVQLLGWAWIEGTVRGPDGAPLEALAEAEHERIPYGGLELTSEERVARDLPGQCWHDGGEGRVECDAQGRFRLPVLPREDPYFVTFSLPGHVEATVGPFVLDVPGSRVSVPVELSAGAVVRGRALYNGEPWKGWKSGSVLALDAAGDRIGRVHLHDEGRYELRVPAGEVRLVLRNLSNTPVAEEIAFSAEEGQEYRRDFVWEMEMAPITGRVTDPTGAPLAGLGVVAAVPRVLGGFSGSGAKTDGEGRYAIEVEAGGTYTVTAYNGPVSEKREDVPAGAQDVDFVLPALGPLALQFVDAATGAPLTQLGEGSSSLGWRQSGEDAYRGLYLAPDPDGRAVMELPLGLVDLVVHPATEGYVAREVTGLAVEHEAGDPITIELERGASATLTFDPPMPRDAIEGHVVFLLADSERDFVRGPYDAPGGPSNWRVNGVRLWRREPGLIHRLLDTGDPGAVAVEGLAPGRYELRAFPAAFVFEPEGFDVGPDDVSLTVRWRRR